MKKSLPLMFVMLLLSASFVSALSIQEQIANNQLTYMQQGTQPPVPLDVLKKALNTNPEFRKEVIKSLLIIGLLMCLTIVDVILKGFAMWRASKNNSRLWFWLLLVISTLGILPLCYLIFSKRHKEEHKKK
jgi:ABC-type glycerol-3-phosphate transport system permease component